MTASENLSYKSILYTIVPDGAVATSGNGPLTFSVWNVTGRIIGVEVGSPAFAANTGSLYVIASGGALWNQNRTVAQVNGVAQVRTFYPIKEFVRSANQGTLVSGIAYSEMEYPFVDGYPIGLATSGTFGGTGTFVLYYQ